MKRVITILFVFAFAYANADIIATHKGGKIENVKILSVGIDSVKYKQGDVEKRIASIEVEGLLYDDGRFITPPRQREELNFTETNEPTNTTSYTKGKFKIGFTGTIKGLREGMKGLREGLKKGMNRTKAERKQQQSKESQDSSVKTSNSKSDEDSNW